MNDKKINTPAAAMSAPASDTGIPVSATRDANETRSADVAATTSNGSPLPTTQDVSTAAADKGEDAKPVHAPEVHFTERSEKDRAEYKRQLGINNGDIDPDAKAPAPTTT